MRIGVGTKRRKHVMASRGPGLASCCSDGQEPIISGCLPLIRILGSPEQNPKKIDGHSKARTFVAGPRLRGTWILAGLAYKGGKAGFRNVGAS